MPTPTSIQRCAPQRTLPGHEDEREEHVGRDERGPHERLEAPVVHARQRPHRDESRPRARCAWRLTWYELSPKSVYVRHGRRREDHDETERRRGTPPPRGAGTGRPGRGLRGGPAHGQPPGSSPANVSTSVLERPAPVLVVGELVEARARRARAARRRPAAPSPAPTATAAAIVAQRSIRSLARPAAPNAAASSGARLAEEHGRPAARPPRPRELP